MFSRVKVVLFFFLFPFVLSAQVEPMLVLNAENAESLRRDVREARLQSNVFKPIEVTTDIYQYSHKYDVYGRISETIIKKYGINSEKYEYNYTQDSTLFNGYEWMNDKWELNTKIVSKYDEPGFLLNESIYHWISGNWIKRLEYERIYDGNHKLVVSGNYSFDNSGNLSGHKTFYNYDVNGNNAEIVKHVYKKGKWENDNITLFEYDAAGNLLSSVLKYWNEGDWGNRTKIVYSYNAEGLTADIKNYNWEAADWKFKEMTGYVYDDQKRVIELLKVDASGSKEVRTLSITEYDGNGEVNQRFFKVWNYDFNIWVNSSKQSVTIADNLRISSYENWDGDKWINSERNTSKFDGTGNELWELKELWNDVWVSDWKRTWEYDGYGNSIKAEYYYGPDLIAAPGMLTMVYDNGKFNVYENTSKIIAVFGMFTDAAEEGAAGLSFRLEGNYPNPFNPVTVIRYSVGSESGVRIAVYNSLGEEVRVLKNEVMQAGEYEVRFDGSGLSSGVYLYEMRTTAGVRQVKKMMMVK